MLALWQVVRLWYDHNTQYYYTMQKDEAEEKYNIKVLFTALREIGCIRFYFFFLEDAKKNTLSSLAATATYERGNRNERRRRKKIVW